jgi:hypothetical protein
MKKIILFLSLILSWIYLANFIGAITVTKNSWEVLDNLTWTSISSLTNKIDVSSSDIKLNWKLYVTWKICDNSWKCLWDSIEWTITNPWKSCLDLKNKWINIDDSYYIKPDWYAGSPFEVYCDMTTNWWGRTRYINIKWNYTFSDAKNCWSWTQISNTNLECFNPNRYNMAASSMLLKRDWTNYFKNDLNWISSVSTEYKFAWTSYPCRWHAQYMNIMWNKWETSLIMDNAINVRLWYSFCDSASWEIWWMADPNDYPNSYVIKSGSWFWPTPWTYAADAIATEIFIRENSWLWTTSDNPWKSCKQILADSTWITWNWNYYIKPDWYAWAPFKVYCDMTTDGWWWTMVVAQFEQDPVTDWNEWIQGDYDPTLTTKKWFALNTSQLPVDRTQTAFWKDLDPTFVWYSNFEYKTWDIAVETLLNKKDNINYQVHRSKTSYYSYHDPESTLWADSTRNDSLTYDETWWAKDSWAFAPNQTNPDYRWRRMKGLSSVSEDYPWTVWVR